MDQPNPIGLSAPEELAQVNLLLDEQRQVILALGTLVTELMQTLAHYEGLLHAAGISLTAGPPRPES